MIIKIIQKDRFAAECENEYMEKQSNREKTSHKKEKITSKQVVAIIGVTLLVLLYIITLVVAIVDNSESGRWFMSCIFGTVAIPLLIWIYIWLYGKFTGKHTIADPEQDQQDLGEE